MKSKRMIVIGTELFALFCFFTVLVKFTDVQPSGFGTSEIGFARLNLFFKDLTPFNNVAYMISQFLGFLGLAVVGFFAMCGLVSLIKERDFTKVDIRLYVLGLFYIFVGILYVLFNKVLIINFRPSAVDLESSYPSSHTVLACFVFLSAAVMVKALFGKNVKIPAYILAVATVLSRMISGVHWFTDILGSILLSASLFCLFQGTCSLLQVDQR